MAKFCNKCNKKIGFFENVYDGLCLQCYNIEIENERKKKEEKNIKIEEEVKRINREKRLEELRLIKENSIKEKIKMKSTYELLKTQINNDVNLYWIYINMEKSLERLSFETKDNNDHSAIFNISDLESELENKAYKEDKSIFLETVCKYLSNTKETYNIIDVKEAFKNKKIFVEIVNKYSKPQNNDEWQATYNYYSTNETYDSKDELDALLSECIAKSNEYISSFFYGLDRKMDFDSQKTYHTFNTILISAIKSNFKYKYNLFNIVQLYCYSYIFCYIFAILKKTFKINDELYSIFKKLISKQDLDNDYIFSKLYPMYINIYNNMFDEILEKNEFRILLNAERKRNMFLEFGKECSFIYISNAKLLEYKSKIKELNNKINKKFSEYSLENIEELKSEIIEIFNNIDFEYFTEITKIISIYPSYEEGLYTEIIISLGNYIPEQLYFYFLYNKDKYANNIKKRYSKIIAEKERDRYLKDNYDLEDNIVEDKYSYNNIQNGYEFEEYVANIYRKLGYSIEEVTKKSGDQGADVVAFNEEEKIVIQVKYYSNPVGNSAVQEVVASIGYYNAQRGIVVTNSTFTKSAIELANSNSIELVDGDKLDEIKSNILNTSSNNENGVTYDIFIKEDMEELYRKLLDGKEDIFSFETDIKLYCNIFYESFKSIFSHFEQIKDNVVINNLIEVIEEHYIKIYEYEYDNEILSKLVKDMIGGLHLKFLVESMEENNKEYFGNSNDAEKLLLVYALTYNNEFDSMNNLDYLKSIINLSGFNVDEETLIENIDYIHKETNN